MTRAALVVILILFSISSVNFVDSLVQDNLGKFLGTFTGIKQYIPILFSLCAKKKRKKNIFVARAYSAHCVTTRLSFPEWKYLNCWISCATSHKVLTRIWNATLVTVASIARASYHRASPCWRPCRRAPTIISTTPVTAIVRLICEYVHKKPIVYFHPLYIVYFVIFYL